MSMGKVLTLASMMALFFASASFAGDPGVDYTAEFAAASVPGQPGFAREKLNYVSGGDLGVDYTAEFAAASVPGQPSR